MSDFDPNDYTYYDPNTGEIILDMHQEFLKAFLKRLRHIVKQMASYLSRSTGLDVTSRVYVSDLLADTDIVFRVVFVVTEVDSIFGRDHLDRLIPPNEIFVHDILSNIQKYVPEYTLTLTTYIIDTDEISTIFSFDFELE